jgi:hypothetical protein
MSTSELRDEINRIHMDVTGRRAGNRVVDVYIDHIRQDRWTLADIERDIRQNGGGGAADGRTGGSIFGGGTPGVFGGAGSLSGTGNGSFRTSRFTDTIVRASIRSLSATEAEIILETDRNRELRLAGRIDRQDDRQMNVSIYTIDGRSSSGSLTVSYNRNNVLTRIDGSGDVNRERFDIRFEGRR